MKARLLPLPVVPLLLALAACDGDRSAAGESPVPTGGDHQPQNPSPYGTGAQETRSPEEAKAATSPNDDGKPAGEERD